MVSVQAQNALSEDILQSKVIEYLRFPLIIGVVFIHVNIAKYIDINDKVTSDNYPLVYYVTNIFSEGLARVAVPLFFFISGFLFFYKIDNFTKEIYFIKLKKRIKSLLIPYIFWNLLAYITYFYLCKLPFLNSFFSYSEQTPSLLQGLIGFPAENGELYPFVYPFWFIRDLIICIIISPVIFFVITKSHHFGLILLGIGWFLGYSFSEIGIRELHIDSLFFFSFGAWFSCHKINFIIIARELKLLTFIYPIIIGIDVLTKGRDYNIYIHNFGILIGIIFWFIVIAYLIENRNVKSVPFLTAASFFIFAIHEPWLTSQIKKLALLIIQPKSEISFVISYFLIVIITIIIALILYFFLKKIIPSFTKIITGGR